MRRSSILHLLLIALPYISAVPLQRGSPPKKIYVPQFSKLQQDQPEFTIKTVKAKHPANASSLTDTVQKLVPDVIPAVAPLQAFACHKHIKLHPDDISCPAECPFLRAEPTRFCQFKCVHQSDCNSDNPLASYANPVTKRCEACRVSGCHTCSISHDHCGQCDPGYELVDHKCLSAARHYWHAFFVFLGCIGIFLAYYLFALFYLRPVTNEDALNAGVEFRSHEIIRVKGRDGELHRVSVFSRLWSVDFGYCGGGLMLHFRWMAVIMVWSIVALILFFIAGQFFWEKIDALDEPNSRRSYNACEQNVQAQKESFHRTEMRYTYLVGFFYVFTFLGTLWFAMSQRLAFQMQDEGSCTMKDFVLVATGFPIQSGTAQVEHEHLEFLKSQDQLSDLQIIGVSECWDFRDRKEEVHDQVRREFILAECGMDASYKRQSEAVREHKDIRSRRTCADPQMKCVDPILGIGKFPCVRDGPEEEPTRHDIKAYLGQMKTTGVVYITFADSMDCSAAYHRCSKDPIVFRGHQIRLSETDAEPLTVLWGGYGTKRDQFITQLLVCCLIVFVAVILLDLVFYAPYVYYILSLSNVAGMSQGSFFNGLLLGLLITVCNQCIYMIIGASAERCGWTNANSKDAFYCVKYTFAVLFNTLVDLGTVLILAQGYSVDMALQMQIADDSTMSAKALAEAPNLQKSLYVQLVAYIFPSCTLLPFLIEPFGTTFLPFWIGKALVGSRRSVTIETAEECLANPVYDLSRYGDVIVNVMLCCIIHVFTYGELWHLYGYLIISLVVIYCWDQVRVLRFSRRPMFSTSSMDDCVAYLMAMPPAVLLMCLVFKVFAASHGGFLDTPGLHHEQFYEQIERSQVVAYCVAAFCFHVVLHWAILKFIIIPLSTKTLKKEKKQAMRTHTISQGSYSDVCSKRPANYFNTNPVNCLRSKYVYKHDPPCVYYKIGKEHLIQKNPEIGIYFEAKEEHELTTVASSRMKRARLAMKNFFDGV